MTLSARQLQWPRPQPVALTLKGTLREQADAAPPLAEFSIDGPVTDREAKLNVALSGVSIAGFAPYLAQFVVPSVEGRFEATAQLDWSGAPDAPRLQVVVPQADARRAEGARRPGPQRAGRGRAEAARDRRPAHRCARPQRRDRQPARSPSRHSTSHAPRTAASASSAGWLPTALPSRRARRCRRGLSARSASPASGAAIRATASASTKPTPADAAWRVQLNELAIEGGALRWTDALGPKGPLAEPIRAGISDLNLSMRGLTWPAVRGNVPAEVQLSARIGSLQRDRANRERAAALPGPARHRAAAGQRPGQGRALPGPPVRAVRRRPAAGQPAARRSRLYRHRRRCARTPAGLTVTAAGDVLLGDVHVATLPDTAVRATADNTDELLSWQALSLKGLKVALKPKARPQVEIGEAELSDFYSRLVITEQGRLNLQEVVAPARGRERAGGRGFGAAPSAAPAPTRSGSVTVAATPAPVGRAADRHPGRPHPPQQRPRRLPRPLRAARTTARR